MAGAGAEATGRAAVRDAVSRFPFRARSPGPRRQPGQMNKLEAAYAAELELRKRAGDVLWYAYEGLRLRLADKTGLTPDFAVVTREGFLELHETKGFMQDDAAVKLKVAAAMFPFTFKLVRQRAKKNGGGFEITEV